MRRQTGLNATLCLAVNVMPKQPLTCGSTVTSITTNVSPPSQLISPCQSRSDGGSTSAAGSTVSVLMFFVRRCVDTSNSPMASTSSSKNSTRTGAQSGDQMSRMPPRRANCPTPSTVSART